MQPDYHPARWIYTALAISKIRAESSDDKQEHKTSVYDIIAIVMQQ